MRRAVSFSLLAVLLIAVAALAIGSVRLDSATADEGAHVASGYLKLKHGWLDFYADQPALSDVPNALLLAGYTFPRVSGNPWEIGHQFLHQSGYDVNRILWLARLPSIAMLLALCVAVFLFVQRWSGRDEWALVAAALTGFCPNLLAHGRLATPDIAVTLLLFLAMMLCLALFDTPRIATAIALGVIVALTVLVKLSGLIVGPFLALLFLFRIREWRRLVKPIAIAVAAALITFLAVYAFLAGPDYLRATGSSRFTVAFAAYAKHIETVRYWYSGESGQVQYLLGQFSTKGWPHYYLVALGLKVPIAAQLLFLAALVLGLRKRSFAVTACLLFVAVFFIALIRSDLALGVRYALPVLPFAFAAIGIAFAKVKRTGAIVAGVLLAWHIVSSVLAYPGYISYFNEFVRDPRAKDLYLIDSNLDWGQDLRRLDLWLRANNVDAITVNYFGAGDPTRELQATVTMWQGPNGPPPPKGWFALSRHLYRLTFAKEMSPKSYATYLSEAGARYVTTVGGSIDVYRIE